MLLLCSTVEEREGYKNEMMVSIHNARYLSKFERIHATSGLVLLFQYTHAMFCQPQAHVIRFYLPVRNRLFRR